MAFIHLSIPSGPVPESWHKPGLEKYRRLAVVHTADLPSSGNQNVVQEKDKVLYTLAGITTGISRMLLNIGLPKGLQFYLPIYVHIAFIR